MKARITLIHKISPRPDQDTEVVLCNPGDLYDLDSVRRLLKRYNYPVPNTKNDREEHLGRDKSQGVRFVLFPKNIWHSIIVKKEEP
jgi:hypothetical protein